jgi:hypothetical protein
VSRFLVLLVVLSCSFAFVPSSGSAQVLVRIVGRDPTAHHAVTRVVGTRLVPYTITRVVGQTVYYQHGVEPVAVYGPVCQAPCSVLLPPGPVRLGVDGIPTFEELLPSMGATLIVETDRRDLEHALGWTIDLGGLLAGALMSFSILAQGDLAQLDLSRQPPDLLDDEWEITSWIVAGSTVLVTQVVGLALIGLFPTAHVELAPGGVRF